MMGAHGENLTPPGQKARALIALVATAERAQRSRAWLCSRLWSDRSPAQAFASLRQTLTEIRKSLGPYAEHVFRTDSSVVALDMSAIWLDLRDGGQGPEQSRGEFLEGIDVRDGEFEDWLSVERSRWETSRTAASGASPDTANSEFPQARPMPLLTASVDLLDTVVASADMRAQHAGDILRSMLIQHLADHAHLTIRDRQAAWTDWMPPRSPLAVQIQVAGDGSPFLATLRILNIYSSSVEFQAEAPMPYGHMASNANADLISKIHLLSEMLHRAMQRLAERMDWDGREAARLLTFVALDDMFSISPERLGRAEAALVQAGAAEASGQNLAWRAYLSTFKLGQKMPRFSEANVAESEALARRALELDGHNPLTLALCAHVFSFVLKDHDHATDLYVKSLRLNPNRALTWDLFSVLHSYVGQPETGLKCAKWAREIGAYSPYSYFYDTSCCMNAALAGHHDEAVAFGIKALNSRPNFSPALRYLVASAGHLRQPDKAAFWAERLLRLEPGFTAEQFLGGQHLRLDRNQTDMLRQGFDMAGVPAR
jgi:tetratricopeptide (TPR) repeat protein